MQCLHPGGFLELDFFFFLIEVELLYNVVLVSTVQQCESVIFVHTSLPS